MLEDVYGVFDGVFEFVAFFVDEDDLFLFTVEVEAADGFAVVVVDEDAAVGFCVFEVYSFGVDRAGEDGSDDLEGFFFFFGCADVVFF